MLSFRRPVISILVIGLSLTPLICGGAEVDLSKPDSHEKLAEQVGYSQTTQFKETIEKYNEYLEKNPDDAVAATERCLFASYFYSSDDFFIEESEPTLESSEAYLERFENNPVVELYLLDRAFGDDLIDKGNELLLNKDISWSDPQIAEIHLTLATQFNYKENLDKAGEHALKSLEKNATTAAQLTAGRFYQSKGNKEKGVSVLLLEYPGELPYQKSQRMTLLSDFGATSEALELLRELSLGESEIINSLQSAMILAEADEIEEARSSFTKAKENNWNKVKVAREYFLFEKDKGTAEEARQAYTELRDLGLGNDPFLYRRFQLFSKFPGLSWDFRDALGLLSLLGLLLGASLLPLLFLIPLHYWGLLRQRAGKPGFRLTPFWNLRRAWGISALLIVNSIAMSYYFSYDIIFEGFFDDYVQEESAMPEEGLAEMVLVSDLILLIGVGLIAGLKRSSESFQAEEWSVARCIGMAVLWMIPLRMVAGIMEAIYTEPATAFLEVSITIQSLQAVLNEYGPLALFMTLAVITPIVEEITFRGVLLTSFTNHIPFWAANILQAVLFTVMHEAYEFFPFLFAFGIVTGLIRRRSGSLLSCIFLHSINNGLVAWGMIATR